MLRWPEFRAQFITTFLATWTANNYADACARGEHKRLEKPPCEDAAFLAEKAWKELEWTGVLKPFPTYGIKPSEQPKWPDSHYLGA